MKFIATLSFSLASSIADQIAAAPAAIAALEAAGFSIATDAAPATPRPKAEPVQHGPWENALLGVKGGKRILIPAAVLAVHGGSRESFCEAQLAALNPGKHSEVSTAIANGIELPVTDNGNAPEASSGVSVDLEAAAASAVADPSEL